MASLTDKSGTKVFEGTGQGFGGSPQRNVGQCRLDFVNVAAGAITFVFGQGDATFIDLTDPANPEPIAAGIYAYTLVITQDGGGDNGPWTAALTIDDDWYSIPARAGQSSGVTGLIDNVVVTVPWYSDAGSPFHAAVSDSSTDTYSGGLYVQCLAGAALG